MTNLVKTEDIIILVSDVLGISKNKLDERSNSESIKLWDSMAILNLVISSESRFAVKVDASEIEKFSSIAGIYEVISKKA